MTALVLALAIVAGGDTLAAARDLYASAAYEDALAVLNRLPQNQPAEDAFAAEQYRALCLLALGRSAEAERSIEAIVSADPTFRPAADVSPRIRTAFTDVRKRMLPVIVQQKYVAAKASFDKKEFAAAVVVFNDMLKTMTDPDVEAAASQPPLSDLRTLASGFRDLAEAASAPPPPPPAPVPAAEPPPTAALPPARVPDPLKVYTANDEEVVPPNPLQQQLPPYPGLLLGPRQGMLEVLVDANGTVENAIMRKSVAVQYDNIALAAARRWRYRPATLNGVPVKYRKAVQISITPDSPQIRR